MPAINKLAKVYNKSSTSSHNTPKQQCSAVIVVFQVPRKSERILASEFTFNTGIDTSRTTTTTYAEKNVPLTLSTHYSLWNGVTDGF